MRTHKVFFKKTNIDVDKYTFSNHAVSRYRFDVIKICLNFKYILFSKNKKIKITRYAYLNTVTRPPKKKKKGIWAL